MSNVDISPSAIDRSTITNNERPLQLDMHLSLKSDPYFPRNQCCSITQCALSRGYWIVARVRDYVPLQAWALVLGHLSGETDRTRRQPLTAGGVVRANTPAPVDHIHADVAPRVECEGYGHRVDAGADEKGKDEEENGGTESGGCYGHHIASGL